MRLSTPPTITEPSNNNTDTFPSIGSSSAWQYVRQTDNFQSNGPVTDVSSNLMRCYTSSNRGASGTQSVAAGSSVTFKANQAVFHQGPIQFYMAKYTFRP